MSRRKAAWETCKHARCQMSTDPRLRISLTLDVVACGKVGACSGVSETCSSCSRSAGRLFVCSPASPLALPLTRIRSRASYLSLAPALALSIMLTLMCCCSCSFVRRLSVEHLRVLVLSCDRLGFPARHLIAGTHRQAGRQPGNNQNNRKSKMLQ